ncbi:MAG: hypothetical protein PF436_01570 [Prolixibacteraceae bacterium]|jgi:hypothetical protein|nr:hypothetical protein [Prolixibacteraceae bacterium]
MSKRHIIITIAIVVFSVVAAFLFFKPTSIHTQTDVYNAISPNAPVIIKINNLKKYIDIKENEMAGSLISVEQIENTASDVRHFLEFFNTENTFEQLVYKNDFIITLNHSGKNDISPLLIITLNNKQQKELAGTIISKLQSGNGASITTRKYNKANIVEYSKGNQSYYISLRDQICLISSKSVILEEALRLIEINEPTLDNDFFGLLKTAGKQADVNIFINHSTAGLFFEKFLSPVLKQKTMLFKAYATWTEADITIDNNRLLISGFTSAETLDNNYASTLFNQQPASSNIDKILPATTAYYTSMVLSDAPVFFSDYTRHLQKRNLNFQRENQLLTIEKQTGIKIDDMFVELLDKEVAMAGIVVDQKDPESGKTWVVETKSGSTAMKKLIELQENYYSKKNIASTELFKEYSIDAATKFKIYRFPYANLPEIIYGAIFSKAKSNWFAQYDNYLIFGDSYRTVSRILHSNVLGETLSVSTDYNMFKSNMNNRSNISFYCNTSASLPVASIFFNNELSENIINNNELRKFKAFTWQVTSTGNMLYNNATLSYNPVIKSKPQTVWQSHLDAPFDFKPKFTINHYDPKNKEVVIHDNENNFYLINNVGRVLWKIKLNSPILGEIYQIDYFRNGKLQYLFNTENKLHMVDRNGEYVKNFPINFREKATCGIAVFDYDNNRDYRYFVACEDRKIYAYSKEGKLLDGWNQFQTDHPVTQPIQHFRTEGKDFIVATDKMKDYILHRRGIVRVATDAVYQHTGQNTIYLEERTRKHGPRVVATDANGNLHYTDLENGSHQAVDLAKTSENHFFISANIDANEDYEYIVADGSLLQIFDANGKRILKNDFENQITHRPNIYNFPGGVTKIGITTGTANKIHLIDTNGDMHEGFPLNGCTEFSIGFISNDRSNFNLLVGSPDGYLYNYYVE